SFPDGEGNDSDWIEIFNPDDLSIDLSGYRLEDGESSWTFPTVRIDPGGFLVVFASGQSLPGQVDEGGFLHTSFRLSSAGEPLRLI
ncbi:MAG: lamin tail domain-containing protein, partial [Akkermansiaceae bacterium]|nr:lamin tail domain-containing protein [Akkermansiaceae bacterium]